MSSKSRVNSDPARANGTASVTTPSITIHAGSPRFTDEPDRRILAMHRGEHLRMIMRGYDFAPRFLEAQVGMANAGRAWPDEESRTAGWGRTAADCAEVPAGCSCPGSEPVVPVIPQHAGSPALPGTSCRRAAEPAPANVEPRGLAGLPSARAGSAFRAV